MSAQDRDGMGSEELRGKVAIVTGAAGGMGTAIAHALADRGATLVVNDRQAADLAGLTGALAGKTETVAIEADVTDRDSVRRLAREVESLFGSIDILVNNAGVLRPTRLVDIEEAEWDLVVDVNLKGAFLCTQAVIPSMQRRRWGRIVNLSSTAGKNVSTMGGAHYTAAKAGLLGLTRHAASEVAADGITVNAVCPGLIETDMVRSTITPEQSGAYAASFPIPRLGQPEEVAELIAFLASDRAAYITGASVDINGGDLMI